MTWRIVPKVGVVLMFLGAVGTAFCQNSNGEESTPNLQLRFRGKSVFEMRCAICHGLDGLGGEHAPDIVRRPAVKALSDEGLLNLIHDGIPQRGMPGFPDMGKENAQAVVAFLRFLQGGSAERATRGDAVRGRDLFFGKAGCSACHLNREHFIDADLTGFARDHEAAGIRDAILKPAGAPRETATAVARDGRKFSGMIRNEDNASLQLQDQDADGRFYLLMKSSLISVQRITGEPMPPDYGQRLKPTEIDDVVSYILREARALSAPSSPSGKDEEPHVQD